MRYGNTWTGVWARLAALLAVFAAANVATCFGSEYFQKQRNYRSAIGDLREHGEAHVLFLGDSHTAHPLNAYLDERADGPAYSMAFGGDSAREMFAKFRRALQLSPRIDTLVVSAEPHMFGSGRVDSSNRSFADWYFITARDGSGLRTTWPSALLDQIPLLNDDFLQYLRKLITSRLARSTDAGTVAGTGGGDQAGTTGDARPSGWARLSDAQRAARARQTGLSDHQSVGEHPESFEWYGRILDLARERDIRVIGIRYPVHPDYAASVDPVRTAGIERFLRERGMAQIIDLRGLFASPVAFDDPDHVRPDRAPALLEAIVRATGTPLVASEPARPAGEA